MEASEFWLEEQLEDRSDKQASTKPESPEELLTIEGGEYKILCEDLKVNLLMSVFWKLELLK